MATKYPVPPETRRKTEAAIAKGSIPFQAALDAIDLVAKYERNRPVKIKRIEMLDRVYSGTPKDYAEITVSYGIDEYWVWSIFLNTDDVLTVGAN